MHTGYQTLPNIYFGHEHIGGLDDLRTHILHTRSFQRILKANGIDITTTDSDREWDVDIDFQIIFNQPKA